MSPRPRQTEIRRHQILDAAGEVIAERGIGDTRIADIARHVGVSPALIMYYFDSKDRLLGEALAHKDRQFFKSASEAMDDADSPSQRLVTLIEASCPTASSGSSIDSDYALWLEAWARARHDADVARTRQEMDARWRDMVADQVRAGQATGDFDRDVDADTFALKITALIDGLAIQVLLDDGSVSVDDMRRMCLEAAEAELGASLV